MNEVSLIRLLEETVHKFPGQRAVFSTGYHYSYAEFYSVICANTSRMTANGVRPGEKVGICLYRSAEMVTGIWSILKCGAAYVPADPDTPSMRIRQIFNDAGIRMVATTKALAPLIEDIGLTPFIIEMSDTGFKPESSIFPAVLPDMSAYVLFTSGSTGTPKGVEVSHSAVVNLIHYMQETYPLEQGAVVLFKSPFTFDGSVWELFGWLLMGGSLYIAPTGAEKDPALLTETLQQSETAFTFFVPAMLEVWVQYLKYANPRPALPSLRWVSVGGEVLKTGLIEEFYHLFSSTRVGLINVYGPTETTVYATTWLCTPEVSYPRAPIGQPVSNARLYILDEQMQPVKTGDEGEIYIAGAGVAKGYINQPSLTRERFLPDPSVASGFMYRTGDLGRQWPDGNYDYTGRIDFQVKLRGLRIELGEIEIALLDVGRFREAVVRMVKDRHNSDMLVAFVQKTKTETTDTPYHCPEETWQRELRQLLSARLPAYMIPSLFIVVREFPLTPHGKIDRKILPDPALLLEKGRAAPAEWQPENEMENHLKEAWETTLNHAQFNRQTNFFEAGGHSLKAVQAITLLQQKLKRWIPLQLFYQHPVFSDLAVEIGKLEADSPDFSGAEILQDEATSTQQLTPEQREMWLLHQTDESKISHNIVLEFTVTGSSDPDRIISAVKKLFREEPVFNAVFPLTDGLPVQEKSRLTEIEIPVHDLSTLATEQRETTFRNFWLKAGATVFDLATLPLFRFELIHWDTATLKCLFVVHHLIFDGWSLQLFVRRLKQYYHGQTPEVSTISHGEYAHWLASNQMIRMAAQRDFTYWKQHLPATPPLLIFPRMKRVQDQPGTYPGNRFWFRPGPEISRQIKETSTNEKVTPFVLMLAALRWAIRNYVAQNKVIIGTPFAKRQDPKSAKLMGYYTNLLPILLSDDPGMTVHAVLNQGMSVIAEAFDHATLSYGDLVTQLNYHHPAADGSQLKAVFVQVVFVMQNWPEIDSDFGNFRLTQRETGNHTCKADLMLNAEWTGDQYTCWFEYNSRFYAEDWIRQLAADYTFLLDQITLHPGLQIGTLLPPRTAGFNVPGSIVIGEGSLPLRCLYTLLRQGSYVKAVVAADDLLAEGARKLGIPVFPHPDALPEKQADFIFSLNNPFILKADFLKNSGGVAINYHDSLLPRYAGLYATSYAILNGENHHGVVFHLMDATIDTGAIAAKAEVAVEENTTAEMLNLACFDAAVSLFESVLPHWLDGHIETTPQLPDKGQYFGQSHRPAGWGIIDPHAPATNTRRLLHACQLGAGRENPFIIPSIYLDNQLFFLPDAAVILEPHDSEPGTVMLEKEGIAIAIPQGKILIHEIVAPPNPHSGIKNLPQPGDLAGFPQPQWFSSAEADYALALTSEPFWKKVFSSAPPLSWQGSSIQEFRVNREDLSAGAREKDISVLIATALLYLLRITRQDRGWIALRPAGTTLHPLFLGYCPVDINLPVSLPVTHAIEHIQKSKEKSEKKKLCLSSLPLRYPHLRHLAEYQPEIEWDEATSQINSPVPGRIVIVPDPDGFRILGIEHNLHADLIWFLDFCSEFPVVSWTEIPLMSSQKRELLRERFQQPSGAVATDVAELFRIRANQDGEDDALIFENESYSYRWLYLRALQYADKLEETGSVAGQVIGLETCRYPDYVAAMWGVLFAGAAFMPVDPALPLGRRTEMIRLSGATSVFRFSESGDHYSGIRVINPPPGEIKATEQTLFQPRTPAEPDQTAYIIFTSGSTGIPKGVMISRKALNSFVTAAIQQYQLSHNDRVMQFANLAFDTCIEEIFPALTVGATLFLRSDQWLSFDHLCEAAIKNRITLLDLPTGYWRQLLQTEAYAALAGSSDLRMVIVGGEALAPEDLRQWNRIETGHHLVNSYGPTETTVVALAAVFRQPLSEIEKVPLGRPLPGVSLRIVDQFGHDLPPGFRGELIISGDTTGTGYCGLASPEFGDFSLDIKKPSRGYRTGDIVTSDENGTFYFSGRNDHQLKIRGFRVEPGELRRILAGVAGVRDVVVESLSRKETGLSLLVCWTGPAEPEALKNCIRADLPSYMEPEYWLHLNAIPLTINGKTDLGKIRELAMNQVDSAGVKAHPEGPVELYLHSLWCKLLGRNQVGTDEDFFGLGGHSLIAVQMITEIRKRYSREVPLAALLTQNTIKKLALYIAAGPTEKDWDILVPIRPEGNLSPLFLIHGAGLNVMLYESLKRNLLPGRPLYALQARGLSGKEALNDNITEIATDYLASIRKIQPKGPYFLLGFSAGGFIVYEIAKQLLDSGEKTEFAGLIDSATVHADEGLSPFENSYRIMTQVGLKTWFYLKLLSRLSRHEQKRFFLNKLKNLDILAHHFSMKINAFSEPAKLYTGTQAGADEVLRTGRINMFRALRKYRLSPLPVHLDLFKSSDSTIYIANRENYGWKKYAKNGLTVHALPGDHSQIFAPPNDTRFAEILDKRLSELEQNQNPRIDNPVLK